MARCAVRAALSGAIWYGKSTSSANSLTSTWLDRDRRSNARNKPRKMSFGSPSNSNRQIETGVFGRKYKVDKPTKYQVSGTFHAY